MREVYKDTLKLFKNIQVDAMLLSDDIKQILPSKYIWMNLSKSDKNSWKYKLSVNNF